MEPEVQSSIIAAGSAIAGLAVGAVITWFTERRDERRRHREWVRDNRRETYLLMLQHLDLVYRRRLTQDESPEMQQRLNEGAGRGQAMLSIYASREVQQLQRQWRELLSGVHVKSRTIPQPVRDVDAQLREQIRRELAGG